MSIFGLYAGIGGFELGFRAAGYEAALLADKDLFCRQVLTARFPNACIRGDVADITELPPDASVVTAGFPCQNLSMAGDKVGLGGHKTGDIQHMFDLIAAIGQDKRPTLAIENVYFLLHVVRGGAMTELVSAIEDLGYDWAYRVVNTLAFGLPQRRRRVFLVASTMLDPRTVLFADEAGEPVLEKPTLGKPLGFYWTEGRKGVGMAVDAIPPLKVASGVGIPSTPAVLFPDGQVLTLSIEACEKVQGFAADWTALEFHNGRGSPRWRMVGNAVSVPASEWLAKRIKTPGNILDFDERVLKPGTPWPNAAYRNRNGRFAVVASEFPISLPRPSIETLRDSSWKRLSGRALRGFIGRAKDGGLRFPDGFIGKLEEALARSE
jgi:DNA (cytosine-5)-methyltransferase 1